MLFDDLACSQPVTFIPFHHILSDQSLDSDPDNFVIQSTARDGNVKVQQILRIDSLHFQNRCGIEGQVNPIKGEKIIDNTLYLYELTRRQIEDTRSNGAQLKPAGMRFCI